MNNGSSPIKDVIELYYEQENKRRTEWINDTLRQLVPEILYLQWKNERVGIEDMMRKWLGDEGYRMEISPDNILIQIWKGNEQIAQYQTILPKFVEFIDGHLPERLENN